jgi:hypothetical protein
LLQEFEEGWMNDRRFMAALQGVDLDKEIDKEGDGKESGKNHGGPGTKYVHDDGFIFKDPKEYDHLTQTEKEALDKQILGQLGGFLSKRPESGLAAEGI